MDHYPWCKKSDRKGTFKTKEFEAGTEWTFTRCNYCHAVLKTKEKGHWLFGKKYKEEK